MVSILFVKLFSYFYPKFHFLEADF
jgi:thiamine pyrophosphate-dependent acetolactate synthase large subunit-like protein